MTEWVCCRKLILKSTKLGWCWWEVGKKETSFLLREIAGNKEQRVEESHSGDKATVLNNWFLCFIPAVCVISSFLSWSSMLEILLFTCCAGERLCTIHPVNLQYLMWICTKQCKSEVAVSCDYCPYEWPSKEGCSGARTCSCCTNSVVSMSQVHPSSADTSLVVCNLQLFSSGAMAKPGKVFAV